MSMKILFTNHPSYIVKPDTYAVWIGEENPDTEHLVCLFEGPYDEADSLVNKLEKLFPSFGSYVL